MNPLTVARNAIAAEIKRLSAEQARLHAVLRSLDGDSQTHVPGQERAKTTRAKRRLRLNDDVAADISSKVLKAVKAYRSGASRKDIVTYLSGNGYNVGHHFNDPHLTKIVNSLLSGDTPQLRREGEKASTRYFVA